MQVFIIAFVVFILMIFLMSIGYIFTRRSIHGSCGGIAGLGLEKECDCPEPCEMRKKRIAREKNRIL